MPTVLIARAAGWVGSTDTSVDWPALEGAKADAPMIMASESLPDYAVGCWSTRQNIISPPWPNRVRHNPILERIPLQG